MSSSKNPVDSSNQLRRELGKKELFVIAIGQVIGAGVMVLVGPGIGMTGRSVSIAFIMSAIWVVLLSIPWVFISGCVRLRGGEYTQMAVLCGEKFAGFYITLYLMRNLQIAIYVIGFTSYFMSFWMGINATIVSFIVTTFFFAINIFPLKFIARIQSVMIFVLAIAIALFVAYGIPQIQPGYFDKEGFMTHGLNGLFAASAFLTFATFGASSIFQLSGECKNPTRDIPFILITATVFIGVLYAFVGVVASGVLPLSMVSGQNLSVVAQNILPQPIFLFFIVGGAMAALLCALNSTIAWVTKPLIQACQDGWFPKQLAYLHPKYKTPIVLLFFFYLVTVLPILIGLDVKVLTSTTLVLFFSCMIISSLATIRLPKLFPEQWARSPFRCSQPLLIFFCVLSAAILAGLIVFNAESLTYPVLLATLVMVLVAIGYAHWRYKSGKVKISISYEDE